VAKVFARGESSLKIRNRAEEHAPSLGLGDAIRTDPGKDPEPSRVCTLGSVAALARLVVAASQHTQIVLTTHSSALAESLLARDSALGYELQLVGGSTTVTKLV